MNKICASCSVSDPNICKSCLKPMSVYACWIAPEANFPDMKSTSKTHNSFSNETRIIVTANMSAGKSTLINALVGKKVVRTSQKVCTGNIGYIYSKPFEDNCISMKSASYVNLNADSEDLAHYDLNESICIASYFRSLIKTNKRICIIDTPGVNCVINKNHGEMTRYVLCNENYDKLLYVFNAGKLDTDDEISHLSWVAENIPSELIIFVVNKLDEYNTYEDDIEENLNSVRRCLEKFGFKNPVICPISAYFGLLIKKKMFDSEMSSEEWRDYRYLAEQFEDSEYDLSKCYPLSEMVYDKNAILLQKCGIYGLEEILFGGIQ